MAASTEISATQLMLCDGLKGQASSTNLDAENHLEAGTIKNVLCMTRISLAFMYIDWETISQGDPYTF